MIWLVAAEAVALCVLGLLVLALAHSYSGLLARVEAVSSPQAVGATPRRDSAWSADSDGSTGRLRAADVEGDTPAGEHVVLPVSGVEGEVLLAFLSSTCSTCGSLWKELADGGTTRLGASVRMVIVVKDLDAESPSAIAKLSSGAGEVEVVHSSQAWVDYDVPGSPYFVHVAGRAGEIVGRGTALRWEQVAELINLTEGDARAARRHRSVWEKPPSQLRREADVDAALHRAGIAPGDPSLYPEA